MQQTIVIKNVICSDYREAFFQQFFLYSGKLYFFFYHILAFFFFSFFGRSCCELCNYFTSSLSSFIIIQCVKHFSTSIFFTPFRHHYNHNKNHTLIFYQELKLTTNVSIFIALCTFFRINSCFKACCNNLM